MPNSLDIERPELLLAYLRETNRIDPPEKPAITVLAGGVSNRTVLVERVGGKAWVLKQALAKLRVKVDWFSDPVRIEREAAGLRHLATLAPPGTITPLVFEDPAHHLLAMQAVPQPHENWKTILLAGRLEAGHVRQFADLLAGIHRNSWLRRKELAPVFDDRGFFESLRLEPYYAYTASQVPESAAFYDRLIVETRSRRFSIVHGDYSPKNVLVHDGRLILLDHEVIHWGDPSFDLGFAMTHLLSKAHHLPAMRPRFSDAAVAFWTRYREGVGDVMWAADLEPTAVRQTLGCLLARVAGRSPLEYLSEDEKSRQRRAVIALMANPPATVRGLTDQFTETL
ncbi:phosphotransferase family protein [Humisphaera borealis]|uniref:Aminoglycoside phosphotransferase family protein n=1 Tax=Humisphaera borealis TaxID=2807512 RepID=A0A7M2WU74_9BACT|nr:phosphotransferase [Humisphaera borealis]QOV89075.1 aminoglycoside phosphotransferase family protein [Humisphaera borealis]